MFENLQRLQLGGPKSSSGFIGVTWNERAKKWKASVYSREDKEMLYLGLFHDKIEAAKAVNARCQKLGMPIKNPQVENNKEKDRKVIIPFALQRTP